MTAVKKKTAKRETSACFVVTGEALTEIARDMVLSDMPAKAWRVITDSLRGDDGAIAHGTIEVLAGRQRLVGDSSTAMSFETDTTSASYMKTVDYIFAGRVRIDGAWYRPHAVVAQMGSEDAHSAAQKLDESELGDLPSTRSVIRQWWKDRAEHYAQAGQIVVEISGRDPRFHIFEPVSEPPFWRPEIHSPAEAVDQLVATGQQLRKVGADLDAEWRMARVERAERMDREEAEVEAELRAEEDAKRDAERDAKYKADCARYGQLVREQAGDDVFELVISTGEKYRVPRAPFVNWSLRRTSLRHLAPSWKTVSHSGMKLAMDDPFHTDWMLGAGIDLDHSYNGPVMDAATDAMGEVQRSYGSFECSVLATAPDCEGIVGTSIGCIFVLKDLRNTPENNAAVTKARAIITERGGQLAHIVLVAREMKIPVMLVTDATTRYRPGSRLAIRPSDGVIVVEAIHLVPELVR